MPGSTDPKIALLAIEAVYGVDQVPTPAANALLIRDEIRAPQMEVFYAERNNAKGFYGRDQQIPVGTKMNVGFDIEMAGAGVAGTAPKWGPAIRTCGFAEKLLAAAHTGVAAAGAANTITLAVAASAVDSAYVPLRIRITSGAGAGQVRIITGYVGATKVATVTPAWTTPPDATSNYSIAAAAAYHPISAAHESASIYFYWGGFLHKLLGARGEPGWRFPNMDIPLFSFDYEGLYGGIVDSASFPAQTLTGFQNPVGVNNQNTSLVSVHGYSGILYNLDGRVGNAINYRNLPGAEDVTLNDREPSGSIEFESPTLVQKDFPAIVRAGTLGQISLLHGTAVGNQIGFDAIQAQLTNLRGGEQDKRHTWQADTLFKPGDAGNNEIVISAL